MGEQQAMALGPQKPQPGTADCPLCGGHVHFRGWQDALAENERLRQERNDCSNSDEDFRCGIASALGWEDSHGKPMDQEVRELVKENERLRGIVETARNLDPAGLH